MCKAAVLRNPNIDLHIARLSSAPEAFLTDLYATNYIKTRKKPATTALQEEKNVALNKFLFGLSRYSDTGKNLVWRIQKNMYASDKQEILTRNQAMRPDVLFLLNDEENNTDLLQEYFIPFYLIFIKEAGLGFLQFGLSYGLFTLSSAFVHLWIGRHFEKNGNLLYLSFSSWIMAFIYLLFPIVTTIQQIYVLQVFLGACGAIQKTMEKIILADFTTEKNRGSKIGSYHFWTSIFSGIAIIGSGYLSDFISISWIFYVGSFFLFCSGFFVLALLKRNVDI